MDGSTFLTSLGGDSSPGPGRTGGETFLASLQRRQQPATPRVEPTLLSDALDGWARAIPPERLSRGILAVEAAHALKVRLDVATAVMAGSGWRWRRVDDSGPRLWWPGWVRPRRGSGAGSVCCD